MNANEIRKSSATAGKFPSRHVSRFLAVSALALSVPITVLAAASDAKTPDQPPPPAGAGDWGWGWGGGPQGHGHHGHHGERMHGMGAPGMAFLHGLNLTDAQRTQVRTLMESQRQAFGDKAKALHDARADLAKLSMSDAYSPQKADELASRLAQRENELARLMAEQGNKVYQLLTPEQRTQLKQRLDSFAERGPFMGREQPARPAAPATTPAK